MDELQKIIKHYDPKKNSNESDIVKIGTFKFFDYYICNFMGHAVAYVRINEKYANSDLIDQIQVHGGITFAGSLGRLPKVENTTFIGWDYAHCGDYTFFNPYGYLWPINEIEEHCKEVIDQLIRIFAGKR